MTSSGEGHEARGKEEGDLPSSPAPLAPRLVDSPLPHASLACYTAALGLVFWGVFQLDHPLLQFTRSLHVLWVEQIGDQLGHLGSGAGLVIVSGLFLGAGYLARHGSLFRCGLQSLIAHGAAALVVQVMKHLIGRPRPRLMRDGEFLTGPSLQSGLDSFPSGHASASFAVAAVVARRFPPWGWLAYGLAGLIAASRVLRGSHFASDVTAGVVLGVAVGFVVTNPLRDWRASLAGALAGLTPFLAGAFALLWTLCRPVSDEPQQAMMVWTGAVAIAFGAGNRWGSAFRGQPSAFLPYATPAIGAGLALTTGAWLVVLLVLLLLVARWLRAGGVQANESLPSGHRTLLTETAVSLLLVLAVLSLQAAKGLLVIE